MKETNNEILDRIAPKSEGMTVPEGYFEDFATKMAAQLPFREELDRPVAQQTPARNSKWLRVRPYVYMAAMFAGAWCLIKMFSLMSPVETEVTLDNYPSLTRALENEQFVDEYVIDDLSNYDVVESYYYDATGEDYVQIDDEELDEDANTETEAKADEPSYILPGSQDSETSNNLSE